MMSFGEFAAVIGKEVLKETGKAAGRVAADLVVEAVRSGQKDAGWAVGTTVGAFASEIRTGLTGDGRDTVEPNNHKDIQEADLPPELEIPSEPDLPSEIDVGAEEKTDAPEKKGGSYKEVKETSEGDTSEIHHMPADSASPLERNDGPAIKMEKEDHRKTASCGNSREAREYRARQQELIEQGKFREALQMDIDDIHDQFGDKYDDAIGEMLEYVDKLEQEGRINA